MTTELAIQLFSQEVNSVYETLDEFTPGTSELEVISKNKCIYVDYEQLECGEIKDVEFTYLIRINNNWVRYENTTINENVLLAALKRMIKAAYDLRLEEYNEEHAYELAQAEREYYEDMYCDNKMCLALGK